jgi:hypothetical protein
MLRRKIIQTLEDWYASPLRKSLIIEGPQDIGKSFVLKSFAFQKYKQVVKLNFNQFPYMRRIFDVQMDVDAMILQLVMMVKGAVCIPYETLIIMDELDYCPEAYEAMKKFSIDQRYDCIGTVSRLVFFEPSEAVDIIRMHALDFEEFLWANNVSSNVLDQVHQSFVQNEQLSMDLHDYLLERFKTYLRVGGMPKAVSTYLSSQDLSEVRNVQRAIEESYKSALLMHVQAKERERFMNLYSSIPNQIARGNKRFMYKEMDEKATHRNYFKSIRYIYRMGWAFVVYKLKSTNFPLVENTRSDNFIFMIRDIGCLSGQLNEENVAKYSDLNLIQHNPFLINGIADILVKRNIKLYYAEHGQHDFLVAMVGNQRIGLSHENVKTLRKMTRLVEKGLLDACYNLTTRPLMVDKVGIHLPLYHLMFIGKGTYEEIRWN